MRKLKKIAIIILTVFALCIMIASNVSAAQIYTDPVTSGGCTAKGNIYATRVNDYIRLASSGTYVTGTGTVTARTFLYRHGLPTPWEGNVSGNAASGVSGNTDQVVFTSTENVQWVRSEHDFKIANGSWIQVHSGNGLSLSVPQL